MDQQDRITPFAEAVVETLRDMAGVESAAGDTTQANGPQDYGDVSAMLRLMGVGDGCLILSFPMATATPLAQRILDGAAELNDAMVRDCAGELANVVAGHAKALLFGTPDHFNLATPTVVSGPPTLPAGQTWQVNFSSEVGGFRLFLRLPE